MHDTSQSRDVGQRQPTDVPLPQLAHLPELPHSEIEPEYERRERAIARQRTRAAERSAWRKAIERFHDEQPPFIEPSEIVVTFRLGRGGTSALVEWRAGRLANARVLRRIGGPLPDVPHALRGMGPGVALLRLLRSLERDLDQ